MEADIEKLIHGLKHAHRGSRRDKTKTIVGKATDKSGKKPPAKKTPAGEVRILGVQRDEKHGDRTTLLITLTEGPDREVRWVLKRMGFAVRRLKRTAIGPVRLKGLSIRGWRMLTSAEVNQLRREVDLGKA
jgi:16S rRNA U516 pseudouridylate synthase RsuA-like enzyme